ncbi:MAG: leucine-rich repeat protein [Lachnospiraceae bacterium]|nr:leucine-rich repeat protein [Lachnospiraceae bacterium]
MTRFSTGRVLILTNFIFALAFFLMLNPALDKLSNIIVIKSIVITANASVKEYTTEAVVTTTEAPNKEEIKEAAMTANNTFTVSPNTLPYNNQFLKNKNYNNYTKNYYMLRSYLERLDELGGGTLILKDGTYTVSNLLYIGSNITLKLSSGTTIKKTYETGTDMTYAKALFHVIGRTTANSGKKITGYNGCHDVTVIGTGNATINLDYKDDALGFMVGHGKNITFKGLNFKNMRSNHPIELDGTYNTLIEDCTFTGYRPQTHSSAIKEAINIDAPDENNNCFQVKWSSFDKTPNKKLVIRGCEFHRLGTAIGTHRYSQVMSSDGTSVVNQYHTDITIENNKFYDIDSYTIRVQNWKGVTIRNNIFSGNDEEFCLYGQGIADFDIYDNTIHNYKGILLAKSSWQVAMTDWYQATYNTISDEMLKKIASRNNSYNNGPSDYYSANNNAESGYISNGKFSREITGSANDGYGTFYFKKITSTRLMDDGTWISDIHYTNSTSTYSFDDGTSYTVKHSYNYYTNSWDYISTNRSTGEAIANASKQVLDYTAASSNAIVIADIRYIISGDAAYLDRYLGDDSSVAIPASISTDDGASSYNVIGINDKAFYNATKLTAITIPEGILTIGDYAFSSCTALTNLYIPASVNRLGCQIVDNCSSLKKISFKVLSKVRRISNFGEGLNSLKEIELQEGLDSIATGTFLGLEIETIDIPTTVTEIGDRAFENCAYLKELKLPKNLEYVNDGFARNCISLEKLSFGANTIDIGEEAFYNCYALRDITFDDNIRVIQKKAFYNCKNILAFDAPSELQNIKRQAFYGCINLYSIKLNTGLGIIGPYAFQKNYSCSAITIPKTVTSVGYGAFANNQRLTSIKFNATYATSSNDIFASDSHPTNLKYAKLCTVSVYSNSKFLAKLKKSNCKISIRNGKSTNKVVLYTGNVRVGSYVAMKHGETFDFDVLLTNKSTDYVYYQSSDTTIGTVDQKGTVRTLRGGVFQVTAKTISGAEDYVTVIADDSTHTGRKMAAVLVKNVIKKERSSKSFNLNTKTYPTGGDVKYFSGNTNVATISKTGDVTINGVGGAKLTMYTADTDTYEQGLGYTTLIVYPDIYMVTKAKSKAKSSILVKWKGLDAKGYEIMYYPEGKRNQAKTMTVTKSSKRSAKITKLKSKQKYIVKMRGYSVYKNKNYYGDWSESYTVKVK